MHSGPTKSWMAVWRCSFRISPAFFVCTSLISVKFSFRKRLIVPQQRLQLQNAITTMKFELALPNSDEPRHHFVADYIAMNVVVMHWQPAAARVFGLKCCVIRIINFKLATIIPIWRTYPTALWHGMHAQRIEYDVVLVEPKMTHKVPFGTGSGGVNSVFHSGRTYVADAARAPLTPLEHFSIMK